MHYTIERNTKIQLQNPEQATGPQYKAFLDIQAARLLHQAFINITGGLVVDYETKSGFVARKFICPQGEWMKTEYYQIYSREAGRPFGLICTRKPK